MADEYPERPECDFSNPKPLDQVVREAEGEQGELFPEDEKQSTAQKLRQLARKLYE